MIYTAKGFKKENSTQLRNVFVELSIMEAVDQMLAGLDILDGEVLVKEDDELNLLCNFTKCSIEFGKSEVYITILDDAKKDTDSVLTSVKEYVIRVRGDKGLWKQIWHLYINGPEETVCYDAEKVTHEMLVEQAKQEFDKAVKKHIQVSMEFALKDIECSKRQYMEQLEYLTKEEKDE